MMFVGPTARLFPGVAGPQASWASCRRRLRRRVAAVGLQPTFINYIVNSPTLRLHGMSWGVKTTCFKAPGVSLGGSGVSITGVTSLRVPNILCLLK